MLGSGSAEKFIEAHSRGNNMDEGSRCPLCAYNACKALTDLDVGEQMTLISSVFAPCCSLVRIPYQSNDRGQLIRFPACTVTVGASLKGGSALAKHIKHCRDSL